MVVLEGISGVLAVSGVVFGVVSEAAVETVEVLVE